MISRKSARLLAEAYTYAFGTVTRGTSAGGHAFRDYQLRAEELNDFLFDEEYDSWFLQIFKTSNISSDGILKERIMNFHTGDTLTWFVTPYRDLKPENRIQAGQHYLG